MTTPVSFWGQPTCKASPEMRSDEIGRDFIARRLWSFGRRLSTYAQGSGSSSNSSTSTLSVGAGASEPMF